MSSALWLALAWALPIPVQGHATDASGAPLQGTATVSFRLLTTPSGGSPEEQWSQSLAVAFVGGSFAAELGNGAPIADALLADPTLQLSFAVDGSAPSTPVPVGWAPRAAYAARAGSAATADAVTGVLPRSSLPAAVAYTDGAATFTGAVSAASLSTSGAVTAASFSGSGAGLTGVPSSAITGANLTLSGTPSASGHVVTKGFLDAALATYLPLAGGTLTGGLSGTTATFSGAVRTGNLGVGMTAVRPLDVDGTALNVGMTSPAGPVRLILGNRDSAAIPGVILSANGEVQIGRGTSFADPAGGTFTPALTTLANGTVSFSGAISAPSISVSSGVAASSLTGTIAHARLPPVRAGVFRYITEDGTDYATRPNYTDIGYTAFTYNKQSATSRLKVTWTDSTRTIGPTGGAGVCLWEITINGSPCAPNAIVLFHHDTNSAPSADVHRTGTAVQVCEGLGAGNHNFIVRGQRRGGNEDCYRGYGGGDGTDPHRAFDASILVEELEF